MKKYIKLFLLFFKNSLMRMMEYRFDFIFRLFSTTLSLTLGILSINFLFSKINNVAGWNRDELILLLGTFNIVWGIYFGLFIHNLGQINKYINRGMLDIFLTKPLSCQFYVSVKENIDFGEAATLITGVGLVIFSVNSLNISLSFFQIIMYIFLIINGVVLSYSIWFMIMTSSFWIGRIPDLHEAFLSLFELNTYPLDIFQGVLRSVFIFIIPIGVMVTFPTKVLLNSLSLWFIIWSFLVGAIFLYLSHRFWNFALKHYSSASS